MSSYPDCEYLGSDAAELQAFAASLALVAKLQADGHSKACATLQAHASHGCTCGLGMKQNEKS